jgi:hypothetical protein
MTLQAKSAKRLISVEVKGNQRSTYAGMIVELNVLSYTSSSIHTETKASVAIDPVNATERRMKKIVWGRSTRTRSYAPLQGFNNFTLCAEIWKNETTGEITRKEK